MGKIVLKALQDTPHLVCSAPFEPGSVELGVQLTSAGYERRTDPATYDWDGLERGDRDIVLFQYTLSGNGCLNYDGKHYDIQPGQLMLLCIPHKHRYWLPEQTHWEHAYMTCQGVEIFRLCRQLIERHGPIRDIDPSSRFLKGYAHLIQLCLNKKLQNTAQTSQLLYSSVMELLQYDSHTERHHDSAKIKQSMAYANLHLDQDIGIAELSQAAGLSRHHYSRVFKTVMGISPAQWLNELRVKQAIEHLSDGTFSMIEIAQQCGFNDVNYFGKVFRRIRGISPGQFRDSGLYG